MNNELLNEKRGVVESGMCSTIQKNTLRVFDNFPENGFISDPKSDFKNGFSIGTLGEGKATHPWDGLKKCSCGHSPWMVGNDNNDFRSGKPYRVICKKCGRTTSQNDDSSIIKKEWNDNHI